MSTQSTSSASSSDPSSSIIGGTRDISHIVSSEEVNDDDGICDVSQLTPPPPNNLEDHPDLQPTHESTKCNDEINEADDASSKYIVKKLKELYHDYVVEAEKKYHLHFNFCLPTDGEIKDSEFDATPMVLLIGQYSTGKVS